MGLSKIKKPHSSTAKSVDIPDSHGHIFDSMSHNDPTPGSGFPGSCSSEGKAGKGGIEDCFFVKVGMALWLTVIDRTHSLVFKYIWFIVDTWYFSRQNLTMFVGPLLGLQMWSVKSWPAARHGQGRPTTSQWLAVKPTWLATTWLARPWLAKLWALQHQTMGIQPTSTKNSRSEAISSISCQLGV